MEYLIPFTCSFVLMLLLGKPFIFLLKKMQAGQNVSQFLDSHQSKQGTPTMGGILMLIVGLASFYCVLFTSGKTHNFMFCKPIIALVISFAFLGFLDDYVLPKLGRKKGFSWKIKIVLQAVVAAAFIIPASPVCVIVPLAIGYSTGDISPIALFLDWLSIIWWTNVFNLTDGLDGLLAGTSLITFIMIILISNMMSHQGYEVTIMLVTFAGTLAGFLWWNAPKAQMFMGDTGSMLLGALFSGVCITMNFGWLALIFGALYSLEGLSVMIQIASVKLRKKRVFLSSPIHHHFEQLGWSETKIVTRFWLLSLLSGLSAYFIFYLVMAIVYK